MERCNKRAIVAGSDFSVLFTAIKDDIELPDQIPENIPPQWFDDLDDYRILAQISTTMRGQKIVMSSESSDGVLLIHRVDSAHFAVNIPHESTANMDDGEIVMTVELRHKTTGFVIKSESRTIPIIKTREIKIE